MRWEGLQGGDTLLWVTGFSFRKVGLQAWASLIHWDGPTGPCGLPAFQGWGAGGVGVVWRAGGLIDIGCDLPPERGVLALQSVQLEETVSNILRAALSKASLVPCSHPEPFRHDTPAVTPAGYERSKTRWEKKRCQPIKKKKRLRDKTDRAVNRILSRPNNAKQLTSKQNVCCTEEQRRCSPSQRFSNSKDRLTGELREDQKHPRMDSIGQGFR